jgi:hypothetical protein
VLSSNVGPTKGRRSRTALARTGALDERSGAWFGHQRARPEGMHRLADHLPLTIRSPAGVGPAQGCSRVPYLAALFASLGGPVPFERYPATVWTALVLAEVFYEGLLPSGTGALVSAAPGLPRHGLFFGDFRVGDTISKH